MAKKELITERVDMTGSKNEIKLTGSVVKKIFRGDNVAILTLAVREPNDEKVNYPDITFYGEDVIKSIDEGIVITDDSKPRVTVYGKIETSKKEYDGKPRYFQNFVGTQLEFAKTRMESLSGVEGIGAHRAIAENTACLIGRVVNVKEITDKDDKVIGTTLTVHTRTTDKNNTPKSNYPKVACFGKTAATAASFVENDVVCIVGKISTTRKLKESEGDKPVYHRYNSMFAIEIDKV